MAQTQAHPVGEREGPSPLPQYPRSPVIVSKEFRFEAAHQLPHHDGKCARLHGHNYKVVLSVAGEIKQADGSRDEGMVMDFADIKLAWEGIRGLLDHQFLNETIGAECGPTTAENIAQWIAARLDLKLRRGFRFTPMSGENPEVEDLTTARLIAVSVYETDDCWATYQL